MGEPQPRAPMGETSRTRLDVVIAGVEAVLAGALMVMTLLWLLNVPRWFGLALYTEQYMAAGLGLALCLLFLNYDVRGVRRVGFRPPDILLALIGLAAGGYLALRYPVLIVILVERPLEGIVLASALVALTIEGVRRSTGIALTLVILGFIALALVGHQLPAEIASRPVDLSRLVIYLGIDTNAILGTPLRIAMQVILVFILLGQLLAVTGGSAFFTDLATAAVGRFRGGAGKIAIFGSMVFGSISGSAVANVVGTGIVTIPLMRRSGFPAAMAGGIEAVASTGGQLMPPIVGAAVFLMAELIEAPYGDVMLAALLPILLYYVALFLQVDLAAAKYGLVAVPPERIPPAWPTLRSGWHLIVPFVVFFPAIFSYRLLPEHAALWALGTLLASALVLGYRGRRAGPAALLGALTGAGRSAVEIIMVTAGAGIVIGILNLSGFAYALSLILITFAGESVLVLLLLAAVTSIVLGMGMPTVGVYVLLATLVAPALEQLGVDRLAAHLFVLYFGMLSMITPPVALAAYAAANIAGADPWRTSLYAVRLGWTAYIVPFLFIASPSLLLLGAPLLVAWTALTAVAGIWLVTIGFVGFARRPVGPLLRVLFAAIGLALFVPPYAFPGAPLLEGIGILGGLGLAAWLAVAPRSLRPGDAGSESRADIPLGGRDLGHAASLERPPSILVGTARGKTLIPGCSSAAGQAVAGGPERAGDRSGRAVMRQLKITVGEVPIRVELLDTPTAGILYDAAPFEAAASTWGDEVYFRTPVSCAREADARAVVEPGELAFWPDGDAIAIGFGRTPISQGDECRLASPCNIWGRALDDVKQLKSVRAGAAIKIERSD